MAGRVGQGPPGDLLAPPDRVWARISEELGPDIAVPARAAGSARARGHGVRWRRPLVVGAAGLLIGFGVAEGVQHLTGPTSATSVATIRLAPLPQFPQWDHAAGTAVMLRGTAGIQLRVSLRAPARPGFYEVWLLAKDGTSMISLGDLNSDHKGVFTMPPGVDLANYSRVDISLQPFNGSTQHSKDSVVRGSLP